jgi:hypothetical protein
MCVGILIIIIIIYMCTYLSSYAHAYACTYVCTYVCIYRYERDACDPERRTFHLGDGPVEIFNCIDLRLAKFKMTKLAEHAQQPPCSAVCPLMRARARVHTHARTYTHMHTHSRTRGTHVWMHVCTGESQHVFCSSSLHKQN